MQYYYTLIDGVTNPVLTASLEFVHTAYRKTIFNLVYVARPAKENEFRLATEQKLKIDQVKMREYCEKVGFLGEKEDTRELNESASSDMTFTESISGPDSQDTTIAAPKTVRKQIEEERKVIEYTPTVVAKPVETAPIPVVIVPAVEPITNNNNLHNVEREVNINTTLMDSTLIEALNEEPSITSLLEPQEKESNIQILPSKVLVEAEQEVLKEVVKEVIKKHHNVTTKRSRSDYESEDPLNMSMQRKLAREEIRYNARKRTGQLYTGPNTLAKSKFDFRNETHDAAGRQIVPNRAFTKQDDDYLDYAFYGFIREYGTIMNNIMKLPLGFDYNSQRRGSSVVIKALHFRNTFTHVTGTKASGRMILFYSEKEWSEIFLLARRFKDVKVEEILQKSVTMYAGDLEELEAADVFYNPTIMSQYDFKNVILGRQFQILYDYYVDLNTQAVKGVVGEDVESVDTIKTKWVKIDDLELPLFYDGNEDVPMRGTLGVLFLG